MKRYLFFLPALVLWSCGHVPRAIWKNFPSVRDLKPEVCFEPAMKAEYFEESPKPFGPAENWLWRPGKKLPQSSEKALSQSGTEAFVVVSGNRIVHEYYGKHTDRFTRFNSHSVAKAVVTTLTGIALHSGKLRSLNMPVLDILPELKGQISEDLQVGDLLQMTSGLNFSENYLNPYSSVTHMYYGRHSERWIKKIRQNHVPGTRFAYHSSNTWLLVRVLEEIFGAQIHSVTFRTLWNELGVPSSAGWRTDRKKDGNILGFTGFNSTAIGLARIGQLYAQGGVWKGQRLLPESWVGSILYPDTSRGSAPFYQKGWYPDPYYQDFFAEGLFYQYLYCHPASGTVIVRIGDGGNASYDWRMSFRTLAGIQHKPVPGQIETAELEAFSGRYEFKDRLDGDTTLTGRRVILSGNKRFLKVRVLPDPKSIRERTKGYVTDRRFRLYRDVSGYYYEPKTFRTIHFQQDGDSLVWKRRENEWRLIRVD